MRAWITVAFLLFVVWLVVIGPPPEWALAFWLFWFRYARAPVLFIFGLFTLPGWWVVSHVWPGFFGLLHGPSLHELSWMEIVPGALGWAFILIFSYVFWITALSRSWKLAGRWNPFGSRSRTTRPWVLKIMTGIGEWWERETKFGQRATGGFASLLSVLSHEFHRGDIFLGRPKMIIGGLLRPIGIPTEKHMVTIAGTGSGKSVGAVIPNLCLHEGNALVIDPKGELAAITARRRGRGGGGVRGMGQDVFVLDPFHIVPGFQTASYNVFDEMERVAQYDADRPVSYARKVAQALVPSTSKDPYWDDAPRTFISGLLLYLFQGPKEHRNLVRLRELLMEGDVDTYRRVRGRGGDERGDEFDALLTMMKRTPEGPYRHVITGSANSLSKMSPNQRGSVLTMAMEHTSFLDMPEIRRISMKSDFLLEDLKARKISVYLCLPLNAVSGIEGRWLRMFVLLTVDMMTRVNKAPNPPLLLAIDEFPSLGKLDGIEIVAPTMRSQGVRLWVIGQDIEQFEKVYPDSWGSFIGGAEAVQFMGVTHPPTVAWIAERLGKHVVIERQQLGQGQVRESASERALRDPEQIARMLSPGGKNQIVWRGSKRPMLLKICPYFQYMPWWYYARDRRFREKFNRWIWRRGEDDGQAITPPPVLASAPDISQATPVAQPSREKIESYLPEVNSYLMAPPAAQMNAAPGTNTPTWSDAVKNLPGQDDDGKKKPGNLEDLYNQIDPKIRELLTVRKDQTPATDTPAPLPQQPPAPAIPLLRPVVRKDGMAELDDLIGLDDVKEQVRKTVNLLKLERERVRQGFPHLELTHHLVFTGNPGTGKTTVARIVGRIYREIGLLRSGHMVEAKRSDLVAEYEGQTAVKTESLIDAAMDGVLFIDEAYSLAPAGRADSYGDEAVSALLNAMEDNRDRLVVIVAGYRMEMKRFIESNPGLKSRFKTVIDFADYDTEALFRIFAQLASQAQIKMSLDAQIAASALMESLGVRKKGFGNGRTVRNIFEECLARQAGRLQQKGRQMVDLKVFEVEDIPKPGEKVFS